MKYKNKETGEFETLENIKKEYEELLGNAFEFEDYRNNFEKFLKDFYEIF